MYFFLNLSSRGCGKLPGKDSSLRLLYLATTGELETPGNATKWQGNLGEQIAPEDKKATLALAEKISAGVASNGNTSLARTSGIDELMTETWYNTPVGNRYLDWLKQAEKDLEHARFSLERGDYEWACFAAQQAAEKAVKALHLFLGQEAWGHVIAKLLRELPVAVPEMLIEKGKVLDGFYIPPRYPNGFPEGAPFEHFGILQAEEAITYAGEILAFVRLQMAGERGG